MKTRPWPLVVLAFLQLMAPIGNILLSAWLSKMEPMDYTSTLFQMPPAVILSFFAPMPIAAFAIYKMRKWSYPLFSGAILWEMGATYLEWKSHPGAVPTSLVLALYALDLAIVGYFLLPSVRKVYFDRRIRWWETRPRYEIALGARVDQNACEADCIVQNISEGGAFVTATTPLSTHKTVFLRFSILTLHYELEGKIVHARTVNLGQHGYGVEFTHSSDTARQVKMLTTGLEKMGIRRNPPRVSLVREFIDWMVPLVSTGKGWVPEIPSTQTASKAPAEQKPPKAA